ncbi:MULTISPECIES: hypothetical protein [Streptomyces]|uniref:ATP/GTP-binding protein n=1 Tax=Streptomyces albidoflavus TaxID=1886 RepID=A0ABY3GWB5_9ACTN|nr:MULTISPECIES: hypothetical protein [Streptomyces]TWV22572.1 hypothetical protein FRZ02_21635 [Streptomyces albidoflavus]
MADLYDPNRNEPVTPPHGGGPRPDPEPVALPSPAGPADEGARSGPPPAGPQPVPDAVPQGLPERVPTAGPGADRVRIGLWGAPRSGKTTYLAALPLAAMQHQRHHGGGWHISGMTEEANAYLSQGMDLLTRQRAFPEATMGVREIAWSVQGPRKRRKLGPGRRPNFVLDIQDAAGEVYGDGHPQQAQLVSLLARSHGLIYLFDPLGDAQRATESFNFLHSALTLLTAQVRNRGGLVDGRLPHHVSVCVAKFDHPGIFQPAAEAGWVTQDHEGAQLPRIPRERGEQFFQWMCDDFRGATARLVRDALQTYFDPRRIAYYATSAVGFRLAPQHVFDYRDYVQEIEADGRKYLRTSPGPINVLEPLIDLEDRIHRETNRRGGKPW